MYTFNAGMDYDLSDRSAVLEVGATLVDEIAHMVLYESMSV